MRAVTTSAHWTRSRTPIERLASVATVVLASVLCSCVSAPARDPVVEPTPTEEISLSEALPTSIPALRDAFRAHYALATSAHTQRLRSTVPIITQDLLNMTLLRSHGEPERFTMNTPAYMLMAHTSHPPLTLYSIIMTEGFGPLSASSRAQLVEYSRLLGQAIEQVDALKLPAPTLQRVTMILSSTRAFADEVVRKASVTREEFTAFIQPLRPLIQANLRVGAAQQLNQFKAKMQAWRAAYPAENWSQLRVVILGTHQPREQYALKLFFQWLLREPAYEHRVVYAESQVLPRGAERQAAEAHGLELLSKVDFEQQAASTLFDDATLLQRDVMGPAAGELLQQWGASDWAQALPK